MNVKNDFNNLLSEIIGYLKEKFSGDKLKSERETTTPPAPTSLKQVDFDQFDPNTVDESIDSSFQHISADSDSTNLAVDIANIAKYRDLIEEYFAESSKATKPWIKLGIDLGTSSSKVVWRGDSNVTAVCFGDDPTRLESYLFPSITTFKGKNLLFGFEAIASNRYFTVTNFKMCLACVSRDDGDCHTGNCSLTSWPVDLFCPELKDQEIQFVNATYLAKLIAKSKQIIVTGLRGTFRRGVTPKWTANLAVPETFIENSPIAAEFRLVLRTGWLMSEIFVHRRGLKDRSSMFECFLAARDLAAESLEILDDIEFGCSIYPEVGAEVASIVMSRLSEQGIYAFVDIGAGTVDASLFNYYFEDGKPNRPPYAADVSNDLGAAQVEVQAHRAWNGRKQVTVSDLKKIKESFHILTKEEQKKILPQFNALENVLNGLRPRMQSFLQDIFRQARNEKDNAIVNSKIRLVIGGGGSHIDTFRKAAIDSFTIKHSTAPILPEVTILQKPDDFKLKLPATEFHRFAVAYGLSYPIERLPEMIFSKDVKKKGEPKKAQERSRDILYAK